MICLALQLYWRKHFYYLLRNCKIVKSINVQERHASFFVSLIEQRSSLLSRFVMPFPVVDKLLYCVVFPSKFLYLANDCCFNDSSIVSNLVKNLSGSKYHNQSSRISQKLSYFMKFFRCHLNGLSFHFLNRKMPKVILVEVQCSFLPLAKLKTV